MEIGAKVTVIKALIPPVDPLVGKEGVVVGTVMEYVGVDLSEPVPEQVRARGLNPEYEDTVALLERKELEVVR